MLVRQKLLDSGLPVNVSESYLLPMRFQVLTLMSLLSVANGVGRVQGMSRMFEVWPLLNANDFCRTVQYFSELSDWVPEVNKRYVMDEYMVALKPMTKFDANSDIRTWMDAALKAFNCLPKTKSHEYIQEYASAICEWARTLTV